MLNFGLFGFAEPVGYVDHIRFVELVDSSKLDGSVRLFGHVELVDHFELLGFVEHVERTSLTISSPSGLKRQFGVRGPSLDLSSSSMKTMTTTSTTRTVIINLAASIPRATFMYCAPCWLCHFCCACQLPDWERCHPPRLIIIISVTKANHLSSST